jgi:membrane fusion protein (multidrug efflux system)
MNAHPEYLAKPQHNHESVDVLVPADVPKPASGPHHPPLNQPHSKPPRLGRLFFFIAIGVGVAFVAGLMPRVKERQQTIDDTRDLAVPTVAIVNPVSGKFTEPLVLSGELRPLIEASIYARANGYVRRWVVDLGAHVEPGQLLAELDTPEIDRQLSQVQAELLQAEAARDLAGVTAKRWREMLAAKTVSSQEADEKISDLELKKATVEASKANVQRLTEMVGFARVTAPFAGTITQRLLDVGQLVTPGSSELFRLARTDKLRVFVHIPQNYARSTTVGQLAELTLPEAPDQIFQAKVVRTAGALDVGTRTLLTELEVDNTKNDILAGSYGLVRLTDSRPDAALTLPASTVIFRAEGPQVAVVVDNHLSLHKIKIGRDFGSIIEVLSSVTDADHVVTNPADAFVDGMEVRVVSSAPATPIATTAEKH